MQEKKQALDIIKILQNHFGVYTDDQLAEKLGSTRSAVSQWKVYDRIPKKILTKYHQIISGAGEKVVVEDKQIHIKKGEQQVDASYIIDLQKDKIESQKREIARLNTIVNQQKETKNKPAFHFKTKCDYDIKSKTFYNNIATGDTSMTGFTTQELSEMSPEEWTSRYHPESLDQLLKSANQDNPPDYVHNIYKHMLWKDKGGKYRMYNIESYYSKDEGVVRSYYYWVNGDIEGQS